MGVLFLWRKRGIVIPTRFTRGPLSLRFASSRTQTTSLQSLIPSHHFNTIKKRPNGRFFIVADGEGFEPPDELPHQRFSRPSHSTALPTILNFFRRFFQTGGFGNAQNFVLLLPRFAVKTVAFDRGFQPPSNFATIVYLLTFKMSNCF